MGISSIQETKKGTKKKESKKKTKMFKFIKDLKIDAPMIIKNPKKNEISENDPLSADMLEDSDCQNLHISSFHNSSLEN